MSTATCLKCGWVHFTMSREQAEAEIARFNSYYDSLTPEQQKENYGSKKSSIRGYNRCFSCGGSYKNFRGSKAEDCPDGCTIQPILKRDE